MPDEQTLIKLYSLSNELGDLRKMKEEFRSERRKMGVVKDRKNVDLKNYVRTVRE